MAEYIEREELMKFPIRRNHYDKEHGNEHFIYGIETVLEYAENLPAADVAPVRHGRWLTWEEQFPGSTPKKTSRLGVFCDKCHNHADNRTDYCPNCGAKMDEVVNE